MLIIVAIVFILLGIAIKYGKIYSLIAGYNTMSKEEQAKYNIDGIASVFRNAMFGMALIMLVGYMALQWFERPDLEARILFIALIIGIPYLLILSNSGKFKIDKNA